MMLKNSIAKWGPPFFVFALSLIPFAQTGLFPQDEVLSKWFFTHIAFSILFVAALCKKDFSIITPKLVAPIIGTLAIIYLINVFRLQQSFSHQEFVNRTLFIFAVIALCNFQFKWTKENSLILSAATLAIVLINIAWFTIAKSSAATLYSPVFGNINMLAQYLGLVFLILLWRVLHHGCRSWITFLTLAATVFFMTLTSCRSVLMALLFSLPFLLKGVLRKYFIGLTATVVGLALILVFIFPKQNYQSHLGRWLNTNQSINYRIDLWKASLSLFTTHPFGIGTDRLSVSIPKAQTQLKQIVREDKVDRYTHNEVLRILVEDGFVFFLLTLFLIFWIGRQWRQSTTARDRDWIFALAAFIGVESLLQFPMKLPIPFIVIVFIVASVITQINQVPAKQTKTASRNLKLALGLLFMTYWIFSCRYFYSQYLFKKNPSHLNSQLLSCRLNSDYWPACRNAADLLIKGRRPKEAEALLTPLVSTHIGNYSAYKLLAVSQFSQRREKDGCLSIRKYMNILGHQGTVTDSLVMRCDSAKDN